MKAIKQTTKKGYVVYLLEDHVSTPLRNFGWYQSAAIEFCNIINNHFWERKQQTIDRWKMSYNPDRVFTYPVVTNNDVVLKPQKA